MRRKKEVHITTCSGSCDIVSYSSEPARLRVEADTMQEAALKVVSTTVEFSLDCCCGKAWCYAGGVLDLSTTTNMP